MSAADRGGAGDASAWAVAYLAHRPALTAYALALTGNADDAADLIQDVLVSLLTRPRECRSMTRARVGGFCVTRPHLSAAANMSV